MSEKHTHQSAASVLKGVLTTPVGPRSIVGRRWRGPAAEEVIAQSELPEPVKELIAQVVRRTRLWRSEKADVARELVAHFEDALGGGGNTPSPGEVAHSESAVQTESLYHQSMRDFGDVERAASLIRRAKKRGRSLVWQAWLRMWQAMGLLLLLAVVLYAVLALRYYTGRPVVARNYGAELEASLLAGPQEERAWPIYRQAILAMEALPPSLDDGTAWHSLSFDDERWSFIEPYLQSVQEPLAMMRKGSGLPALGAPPFGVDDELDAHMAALVGRPSPDPALRAIDDNPFLFDVVLDSLRHLRLIGQHLDADARLAVVEGDRRRLIENLKAIIGVSEHTREVPLLIHDLVSMHVLSMAQRVAGDVLAHRPDLLRDDELIALAHRLGAYDGGGPIRVRVGGDRIWFHDLIQRIYTDDGGGDGRLTSAGWRVLRDEGGSLPIIGEAAGPKPVEWFVGPATAMFIAGRRELMEEHEQLLSLMESKATRPMWQWDELPDAEFVRRMSSDAWATRFLPLSLTLPSVGRAAYRAELATLQHDSVLVAIALELFRRRHGEYPATLNELVPSMLPAVPPDRFDGRPLRYRLTEEGPIVYSVGPDLTDRGGVGPSDEDLGGLPRRHWLASPREIPGDWILWPRPAEE